MDVKGPAFSHNYASQPLELIVKTQQAKDFHMDQVDKQRRFVEQTVSDPYKMLRQSYEGSHGTYDAGGKKVSKPVFESNADNVKSVDIKA